MTSHDMRRAGDLIAWRCLGYSQMPMRLECICASLTQIPRGLDPGPHLLLPEVVDAIPKAQLSHGVNRADVVTCCGGSDTTRPRMMDSCVRGRDQHLIAVLRVQCPADALIAHSLSAGTHGHDTAEIKAAFQQ